MWNPPDPFWLPDDREDDVPTIKTVSVTYGRKVNLGDFNSATVDCTLWADLEEGEDVAQAMGDLWTMAKNNVKVQVLPLKGKSEAQVEHIYLGLPVELQAAIVNGGEAPCQ